MRCDEYGQPKHLKHPVWAIKLNLTRLYELWRKLRHRKGKDWQAECERANRSDAEFEAMFSKPTKDKK
jgi:hypothetical protein